MIDGSVLSKRDTHGYHNRRRTCPCILCLAYKRGYAAGQMSKTGKRTMDRLYEDDPIMKELLP